MIGPHRASGIVAPLFSLTSSRSWGVGEFLDLPVLAGWLRSAGQSLIQILPITEIPEAVTSPYSALTAMALDPIYISVPAVEDFRALRGTTPLTGVDRMVLDQIRRAPRIRHRLVRSVKSRWLRRAHARFLAHEVAGSTARARELETFAGTEASWLDDYALFQALRQRHLLQPWWQWPEMLKRRDPGALDRARDELAAEIHYRKYVQWIAAQQWVEARRLSAPIEIFGDLPFMISGDSADVWTRQDEFRFDATVGVPPDAFSETGQDWGLPPWRWDVMARDDFAWMRARARRSAQLFDGFRIDHLVGLYRTFIRPIDPSVPPFFAPADDATQIRLGERLVSIYRESGAQIVAEDLGTVPDLVRLSLQRLGVPGYKVFRWERQWSTPGQPFLDPADYPDASVATTGTHDTDPLVCWWEGLPPAERDLVLRIPAIGRHLTGVALDAVVSSKTLPPVLRDAVLRALVDAGSRLVVLPIQDVFGWRDRINTPAQVSDENWTWRLPWRVDELDQIPNARARAQTLAGWTRDAGR